MSGATPELLILDNSLHGLTRAAQAGRTSPYRRKGGDRPYACGKGHPLEASGRGAPIAGVGGLVPRIRTRPSLRGILEIMLVMQTAKHEALRFHTCGPTCPGRRIQRVSWTSNRPCPSCAHTAKERPARESCLLLSDSTQPGPAAQSHRS